MSKETEPIRSRRQLRAQSTQVAGVSAKPKTPLSPAPEEAAVPVATPEKAPSSAAPAVPAARPEPSAHRTERESQIRARDRAALRAYKELVDPPGLSPLPSRRAIRQAQLDAERAPVTAVNPVVSVVPPATVVPDAPSNAPKTQAAPLVEPAASTSGKPQSPAPLASAPPRTRGGRRAAATAAARGVSAGQPAAAVQGSTPVAHAAETAAVAEPATSGPVTSAPHAPGIATTELPEPAAATSALYPPLPGLVPGGSYYPVSAGPPPAVVAPTTEELRILAAERAEAERAAVLAERAQARERLAQESAKNRRPASDPTATNNLAMVTPLDFIEVPGVDRPVLRQPTTTHVPIVATAAIRGVSKRSGATPNRTAAPKLPPAPTAATPVQALPDSNHDRGPVASTAKSPSTVPTVSAERFDAALAARAVHRPGPGNRPLTGGRSSTLKQAEAMATGKQGVLRAEPETVPVQRSQMPPMPADYAHGLEPLDAMTAGLARTQRNALIHWGLTVAGGAALVVGVIMFITSLAR
ncbi:hypothetical protein MB46_08930 [Arthrobacter alpinus]|uniref:hypothetical protein n=1 Tax=Arthrobacter alpinus TaxID=656366 RepID=UPI0005C952DD|nr:hypothetical protein [Arthrobacter alpinus]ALV45594.1 hypothetical protein MB46_08930 [Arthrobacter alpinus]